MYGLGYRVWVPGLWGIGALTTDLCAAVSGFPHTDEATTSALNPGEGRRLHH